MIVNIVLEHPHEHYTNLDLLQGKVLLRVPYPANVSSIIVKLEGEGRTRLLAPIHPSRPDKQRPVLEVHKFLYKTQVLLPPNTRQEDLNPKAVFPLNSGSFEYPFQFKSNNPISGVSFTNTIPEFAKTPTQHVKATLPPTLSGFPGEAEIRYFVKVTVNRPQFFKENPRAIANFTFLPIEPPRPEKTDGEAYARRQHEFLENPGSKSIAGGVQPRIAIDARLPNPAILTANQDVPLRLLVKNVSPRTKNIYLQMLQVELIGYTKVRAHEVSRTESNSWILCSFSNMAIPIGSPSDPLETEIPINPEYWSGKVVPNTVSPSFTSCNLSRFYELEVRVGLGYGSYKHGEDQLIVLPLRLPVKIYSGIAPPTALLEAGFNAESGKHPLHAPPQAQTLHTPTTGFSGQPAQPPPAPVYDDAPPSYEEVVGQNLPPINGYRGSYMPPPVPEGAPRFSDEKKR
ncbi:hypothetical protein CFE70_010460 [Pyrenophora teres f. teres 0-1]